MILQNLVRVLASVEVVVLLCWRPSCQVMCTVPISNLGTVLCSLLLILCSLRLCAFLFVDKIFRYFVIAVLCILILCALTLT